MYIQLFLGSKMYDLRGKHLGLGILRGFKMILRKARPSSDYTIKIFETYRKILNFYNSTLTNPFLCQ